MGLGIRSCCLLVILLSGFIFCFSAVDGRKKVPSAMVVGTVICNTCFAQEFAKSGQLIPGASVAVECGDPMTKSSFRKVARTNRRGVFRVRLPPAVGMDIKNIESCSVRLIKSSQPFCTVASSATSSKLRLKSRRNGIHVYSAGFFTFKPLKQPELCNQKPSSVAQPSFFFFPPIPFLPPPSIGGVPLPPNPLQPPLLPPNPLLPSPPSLLPPNPLLPSPPSLLPPNPLLPSPPSLLPPNPLLPSPPSLLPPNPFQPAPTPFFGLPPLPFFTPPPPPPAFNLPPLPFLPPNPLFPGIPPASDSKKSTSP